MTASNGADAWRRLGAMLIQRRTALDPRFHNRSAFCEATGLKYRLVYDIEEARRVNFGSSTLAAIEASYRLEPGSITRFLGGGGLESQPGAPGPRQAAPDDFPEATPEQAEAAAAHLEEIRLRAEVARRRHPGQELTGRMVFPADARSADSWDRMLSAGWPLAAVERGLAHMRAWAEEAARRDQGGGIATGLIAVSSHHPRHMSISRNDARAKGREVLSVSR